MIDRAVIEQKREVARQKAMLAKTQALAMRERIKHPPPKYIEPIDETGDIERDYDAENAEIQTGFLRRAKDESKRFQLATDSEYWCALCFQTREQKEAFLAALDVLAQGDKYLDGQLVADKLGINLPPADVPYNTSDKHDRSWEEFVG